MSIHNWVSGLFFSFCPGTVGWGWSIVPHTHTHTDARTHTTWVSTTL
uniref:Uncharacterized protein n=1 Tax=Rhizophora mucronata TaxID=61149 RepID=A0A2P2NUM5_RHIMU